MSASVFKEGKKKKKSVVLTKSYAKSKLPVPREEARCRPRVWRHQDVVPAQCYIAILMLFLGPATQYIVDVVPAPCCVTLLMSFVGPASPY